MATLHLPGKNRDTGKKETPEEKTERKLDEGLKESLPTSDPVAVTAPGGPVTPAELSAKRAAARKLAPPHR